MSGYILTVHTVGHLHQREWSAGDMATGFNGAAGLDQRVLSKMARRASWYAAVC